MRLVRYVSVVFERRRIPRRENQVCGERKLASEQRATDAVRGALAGAETLQPEIIDETVGGHCRGGRTQRGLVKRGRRGRSRITER